MPEGANAPTSQAFFGLSLTYVGSQAHHVIPFSIGKSDTHEFPRPSALRRATWRRLALKLKRAWTWWRKRISPRVNLAQAIKPTRPSPLVGEGIADASFPMRKLG